MHARLLVVDHPSRIGDLRVCVSGAEGHTRMLARAERGAFPRRAGCMGQRGRGRWGGPRARETRIHPAASNRTFQLLGYLAPQRIL